jgi:hypothetical protein
MDDPRSCSPEHISVAEGAMTPLSQGRDTTRTGGIKMGKLLSHGLKTGPASAESFVLVGGPTKKSSKLYVVKTFWTRMALG